MEEQQKLQATSSPSTPSSRHTHSSSCLHRGNSPAVHARCENTTSVQIQADIKVEFKFLWLPLKRSSASETTLAGFWLRAFNMVVPSPADDRDASGQPYCRFTLHDLHSHQLSSIKDVHHAPGSRRRVGRWGGGGGLTTAATVRANAQKPNRTSLMLLFQLKKQILDETHQPLSPDLRVTDNFKWFVF